MIGEISHGDCLNNSNYLGLCWHRFLSSARSFEDTCDFVYTAMAIFDTERLIMGHKCLESEPSWGIRGLKGPSRSIVVSFDSVINTSSVLSQC